VLGYCRVSPFSGGWVLFLAGVPPYPAMGLGWLVLFGCLEQEVAWSCWRLLEGAAKGAVW
jgi:hypothetical protein